MGALCPPGMMNGAGHGHARGHGGEMMQQSMDAGSRSVDELIMSVKSAEELRPSSGRDASIDPRKSVERLGDGNGNGDRSMDSAVMSTVQGGAAVAVNEKSGRRVVSESSTSPRNKYLPPPATHGHVRVNSPLAASINFYDEDGKLISGPNTQQQHQQHQKAASHSHLGSSATVAQRPATAPSDGPLTAALSGGATSQQPHHHHHLFHHIVGSSHAHNSENSSTPSSTGSSPHQIPSTPKSPNALRDLKKRLTISTSVAVAPERSASGSSADSGNSGSPSPSPMQDSGTSESPRFGRRNKLSHGDSAAIPAHQSQNQTSPGGINTTAKRSWFANLFNFKPEVFHFDSAFDGFDETVEHVTGWLGRNDVKYQSRREGVLRCKFDGSNNGGSAESPTAISPNGGTEQVPFSPLIAVTESGPLTAESLMVAGSGAPVLKGVRFKVEVVANNGEEGGQRPWRIQFTQQQGAFSTFQLIMNRFKFEQMQSHVVHAGLEESDIPKTF
ncbi:hypothetical protein HK101_010216 [Irineochytrium annulatum]|nr:hypothetical protein HK101_010216 [Irineochytrium annulatum]